MATFDTTRTTYGSTSVAAHISGFFHKAVSNLVEWNDMRMTRNALSSLTDRELNDIGLCRGDLDTFTGR
jgi:uncharacterized protein YjiS (DUF1127 family)